MNFADTLERVIRRNDLTEVEAGAVMEEFMTGRLTSAQIAALLVALRMKGETPAEIVGLARTMRAHAVRFDAGMAGVFDTCGTGGDGLGTINVSSVAAIVLAACGVPVAKHGNRSVSGRCGSADLFEGLGVNIEAPPDIVVRCLRDAGVAFLFAPTFHPSMRHVGPARRELGVRSVFNLLGPLTNPAGARRQLVGVPKPELTELMARALALLGAEHAWVVHGADGLDELSTTGPTRVSECRHGEVSTFDIEPSDFGIPTCALSDLMGGDRDANVTAVREVLRGARGAARDIVVLNAGAALMLAGCAQSVRAGIVEASAALDSGAAADTLERLVALSHGSGA